jgi:hypothetical protein
MYEKAAHEEGAAAGPAGVELEGLLPTGSTLPGQLKAVEGGLSSPVAKAAPAGGGGGRQISGLVLPQLCILAPGDYSVIAAQSPVITSDFPTFPMN